LHSTTDLEPQDLLPGVCDLHVVGGCDLEVVQGLLCGHALRCIQELHESDAGLAIDKTRL
jgi:hypothetical protein